MENKKSLVDIGQMIDNGISNIMGIFPQLNIETKVIKPSKSLKELDNPVKNDRVIKLPFINDMPF